MYVKTTACVYVCVCVSHWFSSDSMSGLSTVSESLVMALRCDDDWCLVAPELDTLPSSRPSSITFRRISAVRLQHAHSYLHSSVILGLSLACMINNYGLCTIYVPPTHFWGTLRLENAIDGINFGLFSSTKEVKFHIN